MSRLRTVIIVGQHYDKTKTLPFYKVGQPLGRGDREDLSGFAFAPVPQELTEEIKHFSSLIIQLEIVP
jgi:hypothetical protein